MNPFARTPLGRGFALWSTVMLFASFGESAEPEKTISFLKLAAPRPDHGWNVYRF